MQNDVIIRDPLGLAMEDPLSSRPYSAYAYITYIEEAKTREELDSALELIEKQFDESDPCRILLTYAVTHKWNEISNRRKLKKMQEQWAPIPNEYNKKHCKQTRSDMVPFDLDDCYGENWYPYCDYYDSETGTTYRTFVMRRYDLYTNEYVGDDYVVYELIKDERKDKVMRNPTIPFSTRFKDYCETSETIEKTKTNTTLHLPETSYLGCPYEEEPWIDNGYDAEPEPYRPGCPWED